MRANLPTPMQCNAAYPAETSLQGASPIPSSHACIMLRDEFLRYVWSIVVCEHDFGKLAHCYISGNYSIALELDAKQLGLGPASKKVICIFAASFAPSHSLDIRRAIPPTTCLQFRCARANAARPSLGRAYWPLPALNST